MNEFRALIFDCDGVLAETEADGHRVAFNMVFEEEKLRINWDVETYGELLRIAGGKERMRLYFNKIKLQKDISNIDEYIKKLHKRKTAIYMEMIEQGLIQGRKGVKRLAVEAHRHGLKLAICSTSNERGVTLLAKHVFGHKIFKYIDYILAGDVVSRKKPDPAIYLLAAKKLGVKPEECCVIEDTENGVQAAKATGMTCIVTRSQYTKTEVFPSADIVVDSLGEGEETVTIEGIQAIFNRNK